MSKVLHLTLKKKWFDMIASGEKKEEYREIKEYWEIRLGLSDLIEYPENYNFTHVVARNGYQKNAPKINWETGRIKIGKPNPAWCELEDVGKEVFILPIKNVTHLTTKTK